METPSKSNGDFLHPLLVTKLWWRIEPFRCEFVKARRNRRKLLKKWLHIQMSLEYDIEQDRSPDVPNVAKFYPFHYSAEIMNTQVVVKAQGNKTTTLTKELEKLQEEFMLGITQLHFEARNVKATLLKKKADEVLNQTKKNLRALDQTYVHDSEVIYDDIIATLLIDEMYLTMFQRRDFFLAYL